ncbi:13363_t:CDS:2 [Acaulospora morrowiae]|uniref:13363_t:CDS:1 n=1 Tax=Acaulospora morrowiae TaxID=94023 RepID=A0A9N9GC45_9GLOM|nr:13363_t:CDS:2 [Acaulospora morrowiae]
MSEYFERNPETWSIIDFLSKSEVEPCDAKIDKYTKSLKAIANDQQGERAKKAQSLLDNFILASNISLKSWRERRPVRLLLADPALDPLRHSWPDRLADVSQIYIHQPNLNAETVVNGGTVKNINGEVKLMSRRDQNEAKTTKDTLSSPSGVQNSSSGSGKCKTTYSASSNSLYIRKQDLIKRLRQEKLRTKSTYEPTTNKLLMDRLKIKRDYKWDSVTNETTEYIDELIDNSDTRNKFHSKLQLPFVPLDEPYSFDKHYEMNWMRCRWHLLNVRTDQEKNREKKSGHKIDVLFCIDNMEYFGSETYTDEDLSNSKPISYKQKLFREMKDQLDCLLKSLNFTKESLKK